MSNPSSGDRKSFGRHNTDESGISTRGDDDDQKTPITTGRGRFLSALAVRNRSVFRFVLSFDIEVIFVLMKIQ